MRTPNGLPAKGVPVQMSVSHTNEDSKTANTNDDGVAVSAFNLDESPQSISVTVNILKALNLFKVTLYQVYLCGLYYY